MISKGAGNNHREPAYPHRNIPSADAYGPVRNDSQKMQRRHNDEHDRDRSKICFLFHSLIILHLLLITRSSALTCRLGETYLLGVREIFL